MRSPVMWESAALCSSIKVSSLAFPVIRLIAANGAPTAASPFPQRGSEEAAGPGGAEDKADHAGVGRPEQFGTRSGGWTMSCLYSN